ncbi:hypothetical protein BDA96_04G155400 [Sorghum bicolor]|uniref:Uncharacterized protein n=1 Tax=Sorghum bicolor TaxID=4558 RepID=A0A921R4V0_SORBI|nr:hypothetical protein BDA96_04G155400 [Sorghum bicolor]
MHKSVQCPLISKLTHRSLGCRISLKTTTDAVVPSLLLHRRSGGGVDNCLALGECT